MRRPTFGDLGPKHQGLSVWTLEHATRPQATDGTSTEMQPAEPGYLQWLKALPNLVVEEEDDHATVGGHPAHSLIASLPAGAPASEAGGSYLLAEDQQGFETLESGDKAYVAIVDGTVLVIVSWTADLPKARPLVDDLVASLDLTFDT